MTTGHLVLVVEHESRSRDILAGRLREEGYRVLEAESSGEAWGLAHEHPVDAVVINDRLRGIRGETLAQQLRMGYPKIRAIVAYTANPLEKLAAGKFDEVFAKPDIDAVVEELHHRLA